MVIVFPRIRRVRSRRIGITLHACALFAICTTYRVSYWLSIEKNSNNSNSSSNRKLTSVDVVVHSSLCEEGPTSRMQKTSLFHATKRRGDYTQYHHISQILEGPALREHNNPDAVCKIRYLQYWDHFPHTYVTSTSI
jgi:hypothetical protein